MYKSAIPKYYRDADLSDAPIQIVRDMQKKYKIELPDYIKKLESDRSLSLDQREGIIRRYVINSIRKIDKEEKEKFDQEHPSTSKKIANKVSSKVSSLVKPHTRKAILECVMDGRINTSDAKTLLSIIDGK